VGNAGALLCMGTFFFIALAMLLSGFKTIPEHQRGVVFRLGRIVGARGPGLFFVIPILEKMVRVDLRARTINVPIQGAGTRDKVAIRCAVLLEYNVFDPNRAVMRVVEYDSATLQITTATLRNVVAQLDLVELMDHREKVNQKLQSLINEQTESWGIRIAQVEINGVEPASESGAGSDWPQQQGAASASQDRHA
jgi:regulator of protease activity HflC (stomatin/prohibitin superfamily)